ncbi:MAG: hypothetical protein WC674_00780 [Candidatus Krumholzibacteriia bacterium]
MKKAMLLAAAVMFVAGSVLAELPPVGYIGVFKDATHDTAPGANVICPAQYGTFSAWIWILPPVNGLQAAEWAVSFPATTITTVTVQNPAIAVALGSLAAGISVAFAEGACQMDWAWTHQLTMMSLAAAVPCKIDIIKHPGTLPPAYQLATCALGYPIEPLIYLTPLYLCMDGTVGVQETNWGAIKSLF